VPFLHWSCSLECARAIEGPAREEQLLFAREQDRLYEQYMVESVLKLRRVNNNSSNASSHSPAAAVAAQEAAVVTPTSATPRTYACAIL
jgi:hypothetical protein